MNFPRLHWLKLGSETLSILCYLSIFAPWFLLTEADWKVPLMEGYWRLALLLAITFATASIGHESLQRLRLSLRLGLTVAWVLAGITLAAHLVIIPAAALPGGLHYAWWIILAAAAWLRGLHLAINPICHDSLQRQLVLGAAGIALLLIIARHLGVWDVLLVQAAPFLLFWVVGMLVAIALNRLHELSSRIGRTDTAVYRSWPPLLVGLAGILLAAAVTISILFLHFARVLHGSVQFLWGLVAQVLRMAAYGLGYLAQLFLWFFRWLIYGGENVEFQPPVMAGDPGGPSPPGDDTVEFYPPESLKWLALAALILIVAALTMYILLRRRSRAATSSIEEFRESYASADTLRRWTAQRWQEMVDGLRRRTGRLRSVYRRPAPATPTQVYHALLRLAARRGCVRHPAVTAGHFQPRLKNCFPGETKALDNFFDAFTMEYYGGLSLPPESRRELVSLWDDFRRRNRTGPVMEKNPDR